jgi:hypothetical protein
MRIGARIFTCVVVCLFLFATLCFGQITTATVTGLISDTSGALVPGANVALTNVNTGIVAKTITNNQGLYRIPGLAPGTYRANISKEGFKSVTKTEIELHVEAEVAMSFTLEVGSVSENVMVEAGTPLIETQSTSLGATVEARQVQEAPLNGRNTMNLISLVPGVVPQGSTGGAAAVNQGGTNFNPAGSGNYQISGGVAGWNATFVDGATVNASGQNWQALVPTQDSVGEFRVDYNSVTPQYGRFAGGVINFSTRQGTNQFHGTVYEYVRNTIFNANTFFNNRTGAVRPALHLNQYGATVGGPILRNKAFFFFSWESLRVATKSATNYRVPTPAEMSGDFRASGPTWNPKTGKRAACNGVLDTFCATDLDPTAAQMYVAKPAPYFAPVESDPAKLALLAASGYNGQITAKRHNPSDQYVGRVDYQLNEKQRVFGRYTQWDISAPAPTASATPGITGTGTFVHTKQLVVGDNYTVTPTFNVDLRLSYTRFKFDAKPMGNGSYDMTQFGPNWTAVASQLSFKAPPSMYPGTSWANSPTPMVVLLQHNYNNLYSASLGMSKVVGHHSVMFGGEFRRVEYYAATTTFPGGNFYFGSQGSAFTDVAYPGVKLTNFGIANFVEGVTYYNAGNSQLQTLITPSAYHYYMGYYLTDTWQLRSNLTVNAGVRWELPGAWMERLNRDSVLLPDKANPLGSFSNPVAGGPTTLMGVVAALNSSDYPGKTQTQQHLRLFEPRVGVNYSVDNKTVLRAGFGLTHPCLDCGSFQTEVASSSVNLATTLDPIDPVKGYGSLSNPYPNGVLQPLGSNPQLMSKMMQPYSSFNQTLIGAAVSSQVPQGPFTYVMQWNANLQRSFGSSASLMISYSGNRGLHMATFDINLNQLNLNKLPAAYANLATSNCNSKNGALTGLCASVTNPLYGIATPSGSIGGKTALAGRFLMPYPEFTQFVANGNPYGQSTYHALVSSFRERIGSSMLNVSYTWSHTISNADSPNGYLEGGSGQATTGVTPQDFTNLEAERSNSAADLRQRLSVQYVLDLPFGKGKRFLATANPVLDRIVSGWGLNGITAIQTGLPLALTTQAGNIMSTQFGAGIIRPNVVPNVSKKLSGTRYERTLPGNTWFNKAAFSVPDPNGFVFGNENRVDSELRVDNANNWDVGLTKSTKISERFAIQFRAEYFNVFNRPQFGFTSGNLKAGSGNFGVSSTQANNPRTGQFSIRLNY